MNELEQRLERWIRIYGDSVLRICFMQLSDRAQAEDAMQDTFVRAWHAMAQFEGRNGCSEKTWLMRIAVNVCRDYRRSRWFRHVDMTRALEDLPDHMTAVLPQDRLLMLDILQMPLKYRQVLLLYYYQDMTLEETAKVLSISRSAVHHRLRKAESILGKMLAGGDIDEK